MAKLTYQINAESPDGPVSIAGSAVSSWKNGEGGLRYAIFRAEPQLPECTLKEAFAQLPLQVAEQEYIFMNGFQAWTYSPEVTVKGTAWETGPFVTPLVRHYGLDRYGQSYYMKTKTGQGFSHGVSYCYFRDGETYRLIASLSEKPGYTHFEYNAKLHKLVIRRDCEGLRADGPYPVFELYFAVGTEQQVFDGWFAAMGITPRTKKPLTGYTSWYNRYEAISQETMLNDLEGAARILKPGDLFQIDDGWEPAVGDWLKADKVKFPGGMKAMADAIHERGFKAGLWLAPFVACMRSDVYQNHPEWLYRYEGETWRCGHNWGGFYALDFDLPEVRDYLTETFRRVFDEWGYDLVKLDFLYAAAPHGDRHESRAARMIRALEFLRELCGDKLILGCGVPLMPAFGLVDYCRISCDVGLNWNENRLIQVTNRERVSTKQAIENAIYRRQLDGRAFGSDPDVFYLRDDNLRLTAEEKKLLAINCALFGTVHLCSDDMNEFGTVKTAAWEKLRHIAAEAKDVRVLHETDEKNGEKLKISYRLADTIYEYEVPRKE